ncbi:uncharacterized protein LOC111382690 isoform X1 [Olea europaea var. sylvestris]|uniref:uncharacterized protein LOC111382690 isoform X1 n=1 Tax=Olea europaea var. sylvestris TaxID=158386 RepID=UPI000C1D856A|nr:uncharacterized protein LOC111382690 isoform X1 [Olea europaea var. sylvestris]
MTGVTLREVLELVQAEAPERVWFLVVQLSWKLLRSQLPILPRLSELVILEVLWGGLRRLFLEVQDYKNKLEPISLQHKLISWLRICSCFRWEQINVVFGNVTFSFGRRMKFLKSAIILLAIYRPHGTRTTRGTTIILLVISTS